MMLWLPLQAFAGFGGSVCAMPAQTRSAQGVDMSQGQISAAHGHHASASTDAMGSRQATDDGAGLLHADASDPQCGDCGMACAAFAVHQIVSGPHDVLGEGPAVHGAQCFASAATHRALEPPITAA